MKRWIRRSKNGELAGFLRLRFKWSRCGRRFLAIDECDPAAWKQKRILRLSWAEGKTRIMKITQEAQVTPDQVEARCGFCEALRQGGVRTIRYLKTKSGYCLEDEGYLITLEEDAGPAFDKISLALAAKIGTLTAQMHKTALAMELHLPYSTIFEPMGRNEVNALPLLSQWIQQGRLDRWTNLVRQIVRERIRTEAALGYGIHCLTLRVRAIYPLAIWGVRQREI